MQSNAVNSITTSQILEVLERFSKIEGCPIVPIFLGAPGLGKSYVVDLFARMSGRQLFDVRLGNLTPTDIRMPFVDHERKISGFYVTEELPCHCSADGKYLIFFDEITHAGVPMQKIFMQASNDRRIGTHLFPPNTFIVGAGNQVSHKSGAEKLGVAQLNRTAVFIIVPDLSSFQGWLSDVGRYPEIEAFTRTNPGVAYDFDLTKWNGEENIPTFRSITALGAITNTYKDGAGNYLQDPITDAMFPRYCTAAVGCKAGEAYFAFLKLAHSIGSVQELLKNPTTCKIPDDLSIKWIIACKLAGVATPENIGAVLTVSERLAGAKSMFSSFVGKMIFKQKPDLRATPPMRAWFLDHQADFTGRAS